MKNILFIFSALFTVTMASVTNAQIVNIESARMQSDTVGWQGGLGMGMSLTQNTTKIFGAEAEAQLQYKTSNDRGLWLIIGNYNYLRVGGNDNISNYYTHVRYNKKVTEWLRWEFFGQFMNNDITQIDSRINVGTGPRFKLIKSKFFRMYAGVLFMYEREKEKTNPVIEHNDLRNSNYLSFTWLPQPNIELISTTYFQPLVKQLSDYRFLNQAIFKVKASPHFGLSVKWNYLHDRRPAGVAPKTTYNFSTGIDYDF